MKVRRPLKIVLWIAAGLGALLLLVVAAGILVLRSDWFSEKVRARIVNEVERVSGGRSEIGSFRFDWSTMTAEVAPFVLRGTEPPSEEPLFRAESVRVGLKIISAFRRDVDIAFLYVEQPRVNILVDDKGVTNFPTPKVRRIRKDPIEQLIDLAVQEITLKNGSIRYGDQRLPLHIHGRYLNAKLAYDFNGPSYQGKLNMQEMTVEARPVLPMTFALDSQVGLYRDRIMVHQSRMSLKDTQVEASGVIEDFKKLRVALDIRASGTLAEIGPPLRLPKPHEGSVNFTGKLGYVSGEQVRIDGRVTGQHMAVRQARVNIADISLESDISFTPDEIRLRGTTVHALDGVFHGMMEIRRLDKFKVNGEMTGVSVRSLTRMAGLTPSDLAGTLNGPVEVIGSFRGGFRDVKAGGRFKVAATKDGVPVGGFLEAAYDARRQTLQLGNSYLTLPSSRIDLRGSLGQQLTVRLRSSNLNDLLPGLAMLSSDAPKQLPVQLLPGGSATFEGTVTGALTQPQIAGDVTVVNAQFRDQRIDRLTARVAANPSSLQVGSLAVGQDALRLSGILNAELRNWKLQDELPLTGEITLQNASVAKLLADAGQKAPIDGVLNATINVSGSAGDPRATAKLTVDKLEIFGERFDRFRAQVRYAGAGLELIDGVAEAGSARVLVSGAYNHPPGDYRNGRLDYHITTKGWTLQNVQNLRKLGPGGAGAFQLEARGRAEVRNGEVLLETLDGEVSVRDLSVDGRAIGDFTVDARTTGRQLTLGLAGVLRGSKLSGNASVTLSGDYPATGQVAFSPLTFSTVQDLALAARGREPLPFDGVAEGQIAFRGPLRTPEALRGSIQLTTVQVVPARRGFTPRQARELSLRNAEPVSIDYEGKAFNVRNAHLIGTDTDLRISGRIDPAGTSPWDLKVAGNLNLGVLQDFNPDLVSSGVAVLNASVRGTLQDPRLMGRMELKNASFYLNDVPNGLDDANGTVLFDERRATIESLQAKTGGGDVALSGFVGFGGEFVYRLQARAERVRIRYPEGVSTTANGTLALSGSVSRSILSGVVTVLRAGFNPRTDIGSLLVAAPVPVAGPATQNPFLRNMQLDVRIETVPNLQFVTSLTTDLQAEADLRLRGTAARPAVLGRVVVSQGEIRFFGNKYTINRGEIGFYNPVRIEPVLDLDLETRVRGVLVNINFNGSLKKLNASYRSDPPLQSSEIIALLAVGRAPGSNATLASSQILSNQSMWNAGTNSLLGQAVSAPISGRLQRFFGVSRLKIDPQLTGLSAIPQARLTIEQQISRDVTLTYVTNLSQANQQIIRLEWDVNRTWSVVAVREENGVFGVDFLFKKRLK